MLYNSDSGDKYNTTAHIVSIMTGPPPPPPVAVMMISRTTVYGVCDVVQISFITRAHNAPAAENMFISPANWSYCTCTGRVRRDCTATIERAYNIRRRKNNDAHAESERRIRTYDGRSKYFPENRMRNKICADRGQQWDRDRGRRRRVYLHVHTRITGR